MKTTITAGLILALTAGSASALQRHQGHAGHGPAGDPAHSRHAAVAGRGARVMPFDLDRSLHVFERLPEGGLQTVVSKDGAPDQVALIREHLRIEAAAFARGEYRSPAAIHGGDMPGLADLSRAAGRVRIVFEPVDRGARIRFSATDAALIKAIHAWFDAQLSDHGAHAVAGRASGS